MAFDAIQWAYEQNGLGGTTKFVLVTLSKHSGMDRRCWPSQRLLTQECDLSERTIQASLNRLQNAGLITREKRNTAGGRATDMYRVCLPDVEVEESQPADAAPTPNPQMLPLVPADPAGTYSAFKSLKVHRKSTGASPAGYTPAFEAFWREYPKKVDKKAAFPTWKAKVKAGADSAVLIAAARRYAEDCYRMRTEPQFIKHPKTWLNAESWNNAPLASSVGSAAEPQLRLDPPAEFLARLSDEGVSDQEYSRQVQQWRRDEMARRGWVA